MRYLDEFDSKHDDRITMDNETLLGYYVIVSCIATRIMIWKFASGKTGKNSFGARKQSRRMAFSETS